MAFQKRNQSKKHRLLRQYRGKHAAKRDLSTSIIACMLTAVMVFAFVPAPAFGEIANQLGINQGQTEAQGETNTDGATNTDSGTNTNSDSENASGSTDNNTDQGASAKKLNGPLRGPASTQNTYTVHIRGNASQWDGTYDQVVYPGTGQGDQYAYTSENLQGFGTDGFGDLYPGEQDEYSITIVGDDENWLNSMPTPQVKGFIAQRWMYWKYVQDMSGNITHDCRGLEYDRPLSADTLPQLGHPDQEPIFMTYSPRPYYVYYLYSWSSGTTDSVVYSTEGVESPKYGDNLPDLTTAQGDLYETYEEELNAAWDDPDLCGLWDGGWINVATGKYFSEPYGSDHTVCDLFKETGKDTPQLNAEVPESSKFYDVIHSGNFEGNIILVPTLKHPVTLNANVAGVQNNKTTTLHTVLEKYDEDSLGDEYTCQALAKLPSSASDLPSDFTSDAASDATIVGWSTSPDATYDEATGNISTPAGSTTYSFGDDFNFQFDGVANTDNPGSIDPEHPDTLYAVWKTNSVPSNTVTLDPNGGTAGSTTTVSATNGQPMTAIDSAGLPTRTGYSFDGYYDNATAGTKYYNADGSSAKNWDKNENTTLYAHWTAKTTNVSLNENGGTAGTTTSVTATYDQAMTAIDSGALPTRTGYDFTGFFDASTGGTKYYNADGSSAATWTNDTASATLYAQWSPKTYNITYNLNGGENNSANPSTYTPEDTITLQAPTKEGYIFTGWTGSNGSSPQINPVITQGTTGDLNFTANWSQATYTVNFVKNASDATGTMDAQTISRDQATQLNANNFSRTGWKFDKWTTQADGSGTSYADQAAVTNLADVGGSITLYAQWVRSTSNVTFDMNGGTGGPTSGITATYGSEMPAISSTPTKNGYAFDGFVDDSGTKYYNADGSSAKNWDKEDATVSLKAKWNTVDYTIEYNLNGGALASGVTNPTSYTVETEDFTLNNPTKTGYDFAGWTGTDLLLATNNVTVAKGSTGNRSYNATWTAHTYNVAFDKNSNTATGSVSTLNCTYDTEANLPTVGNQYDNASALLKNPGYTFMGWNSSQTAANNGTVEYADGASINNLSADNNATITLYAVWQANTYTVKYHATKPATATPDVSGTMDDQTLTYGTAGKLTKNAFSLTGYSFGGWATSEGSSTVAYSDEYSIATGTGLATTPNATVDLYPVWTPRTTTATFHANNGTTDSFAQDITYDSDADLTGLTLPTREGYTLDGFYDQETGGTKYYSYDGATGKLTATKKWDKDVDATDLYAHWTANTYTVKFDKNASEATGTMEDQTLTYDDASGKLTANTFEREGYTFSGWSTSATATEATYSDQAAKPNITGTDGATVTLYAVWSKNSYIVKYLPGDHGTFTTASSPDNKTVFSLPYGDKLLNGYY